jgi:Chorismate synthase
MGTQAVKGVEIGEGFALAAKRGSEAHDEILRDERGLYRKTNRAGGIEGGVSNGEEIVVRAAMKPLPTLMKPLASVDLQTGEPAEALVERSDTAAWKPLPSSPKPASHGSSRAPRRTSSAVTRSPISSLHIALIWSGSTGHPGRCARASPRARRLHGRGQVDAG